MQIQLQTYTIVATTNDNLYVKYELYRCSRSFTILLFVLHCTPLYHIDPDRRSKNNTTIMSQNWIVYIQFNTSMFFIKL